MRRGAKVSLWIAGTLVALVVLLLAIVFVVTNTDWGREQVRRRAVAAVNGSIHGVLSVGRLDGNLLRGATIRNVRIVDSLGMPFVAAREVTTRLSWRSIVRKRLEFTDLTVVDADVLIDRQPGGRWNYDRIFRPDTVNHGPSAGPGFGDWITVRNGYATGTHLLVRTPWAPDSTLPASARDSVIRVTLAGETRNRVERVPGGFQKIMEFRDGSARMPYARLQDPTSPIRIFDVASARVTALPFLPPAAQITDLAGRFLVTTDSVWWTNARVAQPASRMAGSGRYNINNNDFRLRVAGNPIAFADIRWVYPALPEDGGGAMTFAMDWEGRSQAYVVRDATVHTQGATATGNFGVTLADSTWYHDTDFRVANLPTSLVERLAPTVKFPRQGTIGGRMAAAGSLRALTLDADVAFDDRRSGTSRMAAKGVVGIDGGAFSARDLHLTLHPVQVDLARIARPTLPIGGTLSGTAVLDGSTKTQLVVVTDLAHDDRGAHSAITGRTLVRLDGRTPYVDADVRLHPLSLVTVGRFAPTVGLRGAAAGPVKARGTLADLAIDARLRTSDGGALTTVGRVDLASAEPGYHLRFDAKLFDANAVLAKAPKTALTMRARADGRGVSPATMDATLAADLRTSQLDSIALDSATVRTHVAGGVATVDSLVARGAKATVDARGSFGLVAGRDGTLTYHLSADSLAAFNRYLPATDTGVVAARPAKLAQARARARADSAKAAERTEVERAAVGVATVKQAAAVAAPAPVRSDSLAGSLYAAGSLRGNVTDFSARGRLGVSNLVAFGNTAHEVRAEYGVVGMRTPGATMALALDADTASVKGFSLDSAQLRVSYRPGSGEGTVVALVRQFGDEEYSARADYALHLDEKELHLADLALRFDTTRWAAVRPGAVRWGARGVEVDSIDLRSGTTGRVFVNGRIPKVGDADLRLIVTDFQVADVLDLAQSDLGANGLISVDAALHGTLADPRVAGTFGVRKATYHGAVVPDVRAKLDYANASLATTVEAARPDSGAVFLTATGTLPLNLAAGAAGPRLPHDAPIVFDVNADSLPLELIPKFTDVVADVRGRSTLRATVRGTLDALQIDGGLTLADGRARFLPAGVTLSRIGGNVRFSRDSVLVDSLVAYSGGAIRLRGGLDVRKPATPGFNLFLTADNAKVLDGERGKLYASAGLAMRGPFDSVYVSGAVTRVHGLIRLPEPTGKKLVSAEDPAVFAVMDTAIVANRDLLPAQSPLLQNLRMDVNLDVARNTWVRRSDVNVEVYSDGPLAVHVNRRTQALTLEGVVATDRGEYDAVGKRFQITRGSATFIGTPDLNPTLQATAEYLVNVPSREALTIRVIVGGTLQNPRVSLESDAQPPISQTDLLSYLAFSQSSSSLLPQGGSSASGSNAGGGGGVVGTAGKLVRQQLAGQAIGVLVEDLQSNLGRSLGADVFRISAADVSTEVAQAGRGNFGGLVTGTNVEYGRFLSPEFYVAAQGTPGSITFQNGTNTPLGLRAQRRTAKGFTYEASFEPRYILQTPTLSAQQVNQRGVLGLFVSRLWRF